MQMEPPDGRDVRPFRPSTEQLYAALSPEERQFAERLLYIRGRAELQVRPQRHAEARSNAGGRDRVRGGGS